MERLVFLLPLLLLVIGCGDNSTEPTPGAPIITKFDAQPKLIKTCPHTYCTEGYFSVLNCEAYTDSGLPILYSFQVSPQGAGVNQPNAYNGFAIFEAAIAAKYAVVCQACAGDKFSTKGIFISVCNNCTT